MAKTQVELLRELSFERLRGDAARLIVDLAYERDRRHASKADIVALRIELATSTRELADHRRRSEVWAQCWWALGVGILIACIGGVVALLRRFA